MPFIDAANGPLLILGLPGGGTTRLAAELVESGRSFGAKSDLLPDAERGTSSFERADLSLLHRRGLAAFQMHFASVAPLPKHWIRSPLAAPLVEDLRTILERLWTADPNACIKSHVATLLLPLYAEAFRQLGVRPAVSLCVREPSFYVTTPLRWESAPGARTVPPLGALGIGVWLRHTLESLAFSSGATVVLHPDSMVQPDLRDFPALVSEVYALCRTLARGEATADRLAVAVKQFDDWREMLEPPGIPGTQIGLAWYENGVAQVSQLPFLPNGDWQTVRLPVPAPAATEVFGLLYGRPCRVWMRRCDWISREGRSPASVRPGPGSRLSEEAGVGRLDGAFEPHQIRLRTPTERGPYELELEFLLEAGPQITLESARRLGERLLGCLATQQRLADSARSDRSVSL